MRNYLLILTIVFIAAFTIGCQPEAETLSLKPEITAQTDAIEPQEPIAQSQTDQTDIEKSDTEPAVVESKEFAEELQQPTAEPAETVAVAPQPVAEPDPNAVVVTVNGMDITEAQVDEYLQPQIARLQSQIPQQFLKQMAEQLRKQAIQSAITERLLEEQARANNIEVTDDQAVEQLEKMASQQQPPLSLDDIKALVESQGQSFDQVKQNIKKGLKYQKLMEIQLEGKVNITEEDAQSFYAEHPNDFKIPETISASHILITPDPNADPNEAKAQAMAKAQDLLKQIEAGADFAELAKEYSACPSSQQGGSLGAFSQGQMVPPFEEAAFALEPGQVSGIVETQYGYHIIKVDQRIEPDTITFDQAKDGIIGKLENQKRKQITQLYIQSLNENADIVYPSSDSITEIKK